MSEDGNDGHRTLVSPMSIAKGVAGYRNDFTRGHYKGHRRRHRSDRDAPRQDGEVVLNTGRGCGAAWRPELAQAADLTAIANMDGEGMSDLQKFARKKGVASGCSSRPTKRRRRWSRRREQQQPDPATNAQIAGINKAIGEQQREYDLGRSDFMPYMDFGKGALGPLGDILGLNGNDNAAAKAIAALKASPMFTSLFNTGQEAVLQNASATGGVRGGNTQGALYELGRTTRLPGSSSTRSPGSWARPASDRARRDR
jgi:hypothetical protein